MDDVSDAVSRMPLGAIGDAGFDGSHLGFVVAVDLAGVGLQRNAEFGGLGFRALFHLDKKRIGVGFGDQAGAHAMAAGIGGAAAMAPNAAAASKVVLSAEIGFISSSRDYC
jgi:hypothetical protein